MDNGSEVDMELDSSHKPRSRRLEAMDNIEVKISSTDLDKQVASIINISETGCLAKIVKGDNGLESSEDPADLTMVTDSGIVTKVTGEIVRVEKVNESASSQGDFLAAFKFKDIKGPNVNNLKRLISTLVID